MARPARVCRRMIAAMTANSSADIGMTRSRSVLDGAMTSSAMTSPPGRWYWRMLRWVSSRSSDPDPAVSQDLYGRPFPEGEFLGRGDVDVLGAGQVTDTGRWPVRRDVGVCRRRGSRHADRSGPRQRRLRRESGMRPGAGSRADGDSGLRGGRRAWAAGAALPDPVIDPLLGAPFLHGETAQGVVRDRHGAVHGAHLSGSSTAQLCRSR